MPKSPTAWGKILIKYYSSRKRATWNCLPCRPHICTLGMSIVDLYTNSYTKVYVTVVSYFRAVGIDKPIADGDG